jgi:hypothetical protein
MTAGPEDWQHQCVEGLGRLEIGHVPAVELVYLDALAAHLLSADAPSPPYTIETGTVFTSMLLRAVVSAPAVVLDGPAEDASLSSGREALVAGAHGFAGRGGHGVQQLVSRHLSAAVGELERHSSSPDEQVRSLYFYGLLAIASGPENQTCDEVAESIMASLQHWDEQIGSGFVPPWRLVSPT